MKVFEPAELTEGLKRFEIGTAQRTEIICALVGIRRARARFDAAEVALARRLNELTPFAEPDIARAARRHARHGDRVRARADTATAIPALGNAFDAGDVSGEHIDTVTKALKAAPHEVRDALADIVSDIVSDIVAEVSTPAMTPEDLAQRLADETKRLEADDGVARLERQRRATRLRTWTDKHDGMFRVSGSFDPYTGLAIQGRLNAAMSAMFADALPDTAPDDPSERQDFLRALAFIALTASTGATKPRSIAEVDDSATGDPSSSDDSHLKWAPFANSGPPRFGRPEVVVVVDQTTRDVTGRPTVDWGSPVNLPFSCVEDLCRSAAVYQVTVNNGNVVDPDGYFDLGRTTRLANRAQRRALRALYSTCAVPNCCVRYEFTKPHHIKYWRNGGTTDLMNLVPLCARHHANAHNGWLFRLGQNRELTIITPNGQTMTTGPPNRKSA